MLANKHQFGGAMAPRAQPNAFRRRMCANNPDSPPHALPSSDFGSKRFVIYVFA
jgi:hypothetical protein